MMTRLPIEILVLVSQYASTDTLIQLLTVSHSVYSITIPFLYASIPELYAPRTIRCLQTLSTKPEIARLVQSLCLNPPFYYALRAFRNLLCRALGNMTGLRALSIQPDIALSSVLGRISCQLKELTYCIPTANPYPISKFLSAHPSIRKLTIICPSDQLASLAPDALPALKELSAPSHLLSTLLTPRLSQLSRLTVLGTETSAEKFDGLAELFRVSKPPDLLELVTEMDTSTHLLTTQAVSLGLALVGQAAPFITSLRLNILRRQIRQDELQNMFTFALPWFPNLKSLVVLLPPSYIYSWTQPRQTHSGTIASLHYRLMLRSRTKVDTSVLIPESRLSRPFSTSCHREVIEVWHQIHPGLERVLFLDWGDIDE